MLDPTGSVIAIDWRRAKSRATIIPDMQYPNTAVMPVSQLR